MGFNPPVPQQDSNWEIRAAVLLSLFFQVLLIFLGPRRKRSSRPLFRLTVWSCYLLADWVADLALGLLLNNMGNIGGGGGGNSSSSFGLKRGGGGGGGGTGATAGNNASSGSSSPIIFAFWTPFLLLHLGGPDTITAYSVEDNELWNRHLIGLLFELFSASVIVFCSLRNNPLVPATMLVLVAGVIKYGERTYSLYSGSNESLRNSILGPPEPGPNYSRLMTEFDSKKKAGLPVELAIYDAQEFKITQKELFADILRFKSLEARAYQLFLIFRRLLVDVIISSKERQLSQAFFLMRDEMKASEAFEVMEVELNFMYDMVYTKAPVVHSKAGWLLRCIVSGCLVSALAFFFFVDKLGHQIQRVDVGITYALLLGALALDAVAMLMFFFSDRTKVYLDESPRWLWWLACLRQLVTKRWQTRRRRWSGTVSQMNLIRYCQEKPGPYSSNNRGGKWWWLMIVKMLGAEEIDDDILYVRRVWVNKRDKSKFCTWLRKKGRCVREKLIKPLVPKCCDKSGVHDKDDETEESNLLDFIFVGLKDSAQKLDEKLDDKNQIMEVCSRRGKGVVDRLAKDIKERLIAVTGDAKQFELIRDSVTKKDFDESLLLWHIATDLCRRKDREGPLTEATQRFRAIGKILSEYMLYLLIKQPDMLAATAGIGLRPYRDTCAEARRFFASKQSWLGIDKEDGMRTFLLRVNTTENRPVSMKGDRSKSVLFDAVILAKALLELDEALMWDLVTGVWGEMLSFAAVSGRGRTHVRSLNRGGELITFVWLLMQHLGLSDMYEIEQGDPGVQLIVHY